MPVDNQNLYQLIYISQAKEDLNYYDLDNILVSARKNNSTNQITGLLIFKDGFFIQLLEGSENQVKYILSKVVQDQRHKLVKVIGEWPTDKRFFPNWSMSFHDIDVSDFKHPFLQKLFSENFLIETPNQSDFQNFYIEFLNSDLNLK